MHEGLMFQASRDTLTFSFIFCFFFLTKNLSHCIVLGNKNRLVDPTGTYSISLQVSSLVKSRLLFRINTI